MEKVMFVCFCVLLFSVSLACGQRRNVVSPCPQIFKYHTDQYGTHGDLLLYPNGQRTMRIVLQVNFTVPVQIFNNNYGSIFLYNEKDALPNYNRGSPMKYKITFPVQRPLPLCVSIEVNGNLICSGPRDVLLPNTYLSDFSLQHTAFIYYTTNNRPQDYGSINEPTDYGTINQPQDYGSINQPTDYGPINQPQDYGSINQPTDYGPINRPPVTQQPVYRPPVTQAPYRPPVTQAPYRPPVTQAPVYRPPVTQAPVYRPPVTQAPVYRPPVTEAPVYQPPVKQPPVYPEDDLNNLWGDNGNSPDYVDPIPLQPVSIRPVKPIIQQPVTQRLPEIESYPVTTPSACGHPSPIPLIFHGENYKKGALPWLVAIYKRTGANLEFKCGGTLVSDRHVITAAHCMHLRTQIYNYADLTVRVGVFDLDDWSEADVVQLESAVIHERYNSSTLENDIMIISLERRVTFTNFIIPACLWSGAIGLDLIAGKSGIVAGWGLINSGGDQSNFPQMASLPIVTNKVCRELSPELQLLTYDTTLCAGDRVGTGPCKGDSGGGLYINDRGTWRLRGIISKGLRQEDGSCNLNEFVVFTDTAQFLPWIEQVMKR